MGVPEIVAEIVRLREERARVERERDADKQLEAARFALQQAGAEASRLAAPYADRLGNLEAQEETLRAQALVEWPAGGPGILEGDGWRAQRRTTERVDVVDDVRLVRVIAAANLTDQTIRSVAWEKKQLRKALDLYPAALGELVQIRETHTVALTLRAAASDEAAREVA